jgi:predicted transcriptional regulator of viral defense system
MEAQMAVSQFLNTHQFFDINLFDAQTGGGAANRNLLSRAVNSGKADRITRGIYASQSGRFQGSAPNPLDVALQAAPDAVFCYLTALELHGLAHNTSWQTQFYSRRSSRDFTYKSRRFLRYKTPASLLTTSILGSSLIRRSTTTVEQTIIDCFRTPQRAGGVENLLRSLATVERIDQASLTVLLTTSTATLKSKIGWWLELRDDLDAGNLVTRLKENVGSGPYYFSENLKNSDNRFWNREWKLYLPTNPDTLNDWTTG